MKNVAISIGTNPSSHVHIADEVVTQDEEIANVHPNPPSVDAEGVHVVPMTRTQQTARETHVVPPVSVQDNSQKTSFPTRRRQNCRMVLGIAILLTVVAMLSVVITWFVTRDTKTTDPTTNVDEEALGRPRATIHTETLELESGVPVRGQSGSKDEVQLYRLTVPALHKVDCATTGFKGDPDLYLRFGTAPEITLEQGSSDNNDCVSAYEGTIEHCTTGSSGDSDTTLYVALHAYEDYHGVEIICTVQGDDEQSELLPPVVDDFVDEEAIPELEDGVALDNLSARKGHLSYYRVTVPAEHEVSCSLSGFKGDPDLYMRFGELPEISFNSHENECVSAYEGTSDYCSTNSSFDNENVLYVAVHAYEDFDGVSLVCSVYHYSEHDWWWEVDLDFEFNEDIIELEVGVPMDSQSGSTGEVQLYTLDVPAEHQVYCSTTGNHGDADLFLRFDQVPDISSYYGWGNECESQGVDSNEYCSTGSSGDAGGILYVAVLAYEDYENLSILCTMESFIPWETVPPLPRLSESESCFSEDLSASICTLEFLPLDSGNCLQCATMAIGEAMGDQAEVWPADCSSLREKFCDGMKGCHCGRCVSDVTNFVACAANVHGCDLTCG